MARSTQPTSRVFQARPMSIRYARCPRRSADAPQLASVPQSPEPSSRPQDHQTKIDNR